MYTVENDGKSCLASMYKPRLFTCLVYCICSKTYWLFSMWLPFPGYPLCPVSHLRSLDDRFPYESFVFFVSLMLSSLFIAALWSPAGKGLYSWPLLVMFIVFLLLSHVVS